MRVIDYK